MAGGSFRYTVRFADPQPLRDGLAGLIVDGPVDPSMVVDVRRVTLRRTGDNGQPVPSIFDIQKATSYAGGDLAAAAKFDLSAANLPAGVRVVTMPDRADYGSDILTSFQDSYGHAGVTGGSLAGRYPSRYRLGAIAADNVWASGSKTTAIESAILREGEMYAIRQRVSTNGRATRSIVFSLMLRNVSSGRCYNYMCRDLSVPSEFGGPILIIENASGSGVVMELMSVETYIEGDTSLSSTVRLALIEGFYGIENCPPTYVEAPVAFDTNNVCPSSVKCLESGFLAKLKGTSDGNAQDWMSNPGAGGITTTNQQRIGRIRARPSQLGLISQVGYVYSDKGDASIFYAAGKRAEGIILRGGQCLAVLAGCNGQIESSPHNIQDIIFDFNIRYGSNGRRGGTIYVG